MQVYVQIDGGPEALDEGDGAGGRFGLGGTGVFFALCSLASAFSDSPGGSCSR
jgi:hypothetical protein